MDIRTWSTGRLTPFRMRFTVADGVCAIDWATPNVGSGRWFPFGQPVPVLPIGFHVHDVYHVALLGETGWSEVAEILLLGKRDGYVSGPVALAEEAVIMDRFTQRPMTPSKAAVTLWNSTSDRLPVQGVQLARVFPRCDQARKGILAKLATQGTATATTRVPVTFARAAVRHAVGES